MTARDMEMGGKVSVCSLVFNHQALLGVTLWDYVEGSMSDPLLNFVSSLLSLDLPSASLTSLGQSTFIHTHCNSARPLFQTSSVSLFELRTNYEYS